MKTFKKLCREKLDDADFRALYDQECNVCENTLRIFEKLHAENISIEHVAASLGADVDDLQALKDADRCDPHLVIRLCDYLQLKVPDSCPKMGT